MPIVIAPPVSVRTLSVGGIVPFSTTDWPGKLCAVVFVQGCPWQCAYCHNPHLQPRTHESPLPWQEVLAMLHRRQGLLDAVVFSGGEPTLDPALESAVRDVRTLGFAVGLHTGGAYPRRLAEILPLLDWVALDIKASFADYEKITGIADSGEPARLCANMILENGIAHEFRTTAHPNLLPDAKLLALAETLAGMGLQHYALQIFRPQGCANPSLPAVDSHYPNRLTLEHIRQIIPQFVMRTA